MQFRPTLVLAGAFIIVIVPPYIYDWLNIETLDDYISAIANSFLAYLGCYAALNWKRGHEYERKRRIADEVLQLAYAQVERLIEVRRFSLTADERKAADDAINNEVDTGFLDPKIARSHSRHNVYAAVQRRRDTIELDRKLELSKIRVRKEFGERSSMAIDRLINKSGEISAAFTRYNKHTQNTLKPDHSPDNESFYIINARNCILSSHSTPGYDPFEKDMFAAYGELQDALENAL